LKIEPSRLSSVVRASRNAIAFVMWAL